MVAGALASVVPDLDVITFLLGIPYASEWGHRGFTHSIAFGLFLGLLCLPLARWLQATKWLAVSFISLSAMSHGVLDAATDGGLGIAFFWPVLDTRYFLPWQIVEVSPIGVSGFFTQRGLTVIFSEAQTIWLMAAVLGSVLFISCRLIARRPDS